MLLHEEKIKYQKLYDDLINYRKINIVDDSDYCERHHIIPKCLNGSDEKNNIVKLTPDEHYDAHYYLMKIYYDNGKLAHAFWSMNNGFKRNSLYTTINKEKYAEARMKHIEEMKKFKHTKEHKQHMSKIMTGRVFTEEHRINIGNSSRGRKYSTETRKQMSENHKGEKNHMYGKHHSEETKQKIREARLKNPMSGEKNGCYGKKSWNHGQTTPEETKQKIREAVSGEKNGMYGKTSPMKGKKHSEESLQKMRDAKKGMIVSEETKQKMRNSSKSYICPYCGKEGKGNTMKLWHFDNCKYKEI